MSFQSYKESDVAVKKDNNEISVSRWVRALIAEQ